MARRRSLGKKRKSYRKTRNKKNNKNKKTVRKTRRMRGGIPNLFDLFKPNPIISDDERRAARMAAYPRTLKNAPPLEAAAPPLEAAAAAAAPPLVTEQLKAAYDEAFLDFLDFRKPKISPVNTSDEEIEARKFSRGIPITGETAGLMADPHHLITEPP